MARVSWPTQGGMPVSVFGIGVGHNARGRCVEQQTPDREAKQRLTDRRAVHKDESK